MLPADNLLCTFHTLPVFFGTPDHHKHSPCSVSYTHLDVYKRQSRYSSTPFGVIRRTCRISSPEKSICAAAFAAAAAQLPVCLLYTSRCV